MFVNVVYYVKYFSQCQTTLNFAMPFPVGLEDQHLKKFEVVFARSHINENDDIVITVRYRSQKRNGETDVTNCQHHFNFHSVIFISDIFLWPSHICHLHSSTTLCNCCF